MCLTRYLTTTLIILTAFFGTSGVALAQFAPTNNPQDDVFLALRDASRKNDQAGVAQLAARLSDYDIPSYVDYYRLKPRLPDLPDTEIRAYLQRYAGTAIADRLRNDWLLELGKQRVWSTFDEQFPQFVLQDDLQLKCYALMSAALKGQNAAEQAREILVAPKNYGDGCVALIGTLAANGQFNKYDVWAQVRLAAESNYVALAKRIAVFTDASDKAIAQALDKAALTVALGSGNGTSAHQLYLIALGRLARSSPEQAAAALTQESVRLNQRDQKLAWGQIALPSALSLSPQALSYWRNTKDAELSLDGYQWKARSALRAGDWDMVRSTIEAMPASLRSDETWVYWYGRALQADARSVDKNSDKNADKEAGNRDLARAQFISISKQTNFYGQLALEELGQKVEIPERATPPTAAEIQPMTQNPGLRRALRFFDMGLRFAGVREWNWELRAMDERQHLAAAEFARQKNALDRMVNTSDRTRVEMDFLQRFPTPFRAIMQSNTQALGLDMAWVYGLIRQESRFVMHARSHVGASGLMQIMPATAQLVARKIGMPDFNPNRVNEIDTNVLLGTNYLNMVLGQLDGSQTLASAAYNAGPGRPRSWRSSLTGPVEGAIFAETIPFAETRGYVKNVLSNATYYAALFANQPQSLKARLGIVTP